MSVSALAAGDRFVLPGPLAKALREHGGDGLEIREHELPWPDEPFRDVAEVSEACGSEEEIIGDRAPRCFGTTLATRPACASGSATAHSRRRLRSTARSAFPACPMRCCRGCASTSPSACGARTDQERAELYSERYERFLELREPAEQSWRALSGD